jgi:hypothetical protein
MYGLSNLKNPITVNEATVECPVKGCNHFVPRQRKVFKRSEEFKCPEHGIFISPSTFEYQNKLDNLLWKSPQDQDLLFNKIFNVKRETERIARDNSEDAVTWNVFRYLEKQKLIGGFLSNLIGVPVDDCEVIYWSYSQSQALSGCWKPLQQIREEFELKPTKGSEPDLIIKSNNALFLIEAKLNASNNTVPSSKDPAVKQKYENGCQSWYNQVFHSRFDQIAVINRRYELLRFWLLGSKIANRLQTNFYLVNLVPQEKETTIETSFKKHIKESSDKTFLRATWEDIYLYIKNKGIAGRDKEVIIKYFTEKTLGYDNKGQLKRVFNLNPSVC